MFTLERPNMAVNDKRTYARTGLLADMSVYRRFQMWNTWDIDGTVTREQIIHWVAAVARSASGGKLKHLVLSCHSTEGYLMLGKGFDISSVGLFASWRDLVDTIWLPDCNVARNQAGNSFCSRMAAEARCRVVAPIGIQCDPITTLPVDKMTLFEGQVLIYGPDGNVIVEIDYPAIRYDSAGQCTPRD